jgi:hypothetical protein
MPAGMTIYGQVAARRGGNVAKAKGTVAGPFAHLLTVPDEQRQAA